MRYVRVLLSCRACQRKRDADLQALVDRGYGDVPLIRLQHCRTERGGALDTAQQLGLGRTPFVNRDRALIVAISARIWPSLIARSDGHLPAGRGSCRPRLDLALKVT
jgi:hypothetical protein